MNKNRKFLKICKHTGEKPITDAQIDNLSDAEVDKIVNYIRIVSEQAIANATYYARNKS
jgi:hypothetical protein